MRHFAASVSIGVWVVAAATLLACGGQGRGARQGAAGSASRTANTGEAGRALPTLRCTPAATVNFGDSLSCVLVNLGPDDELAWSFESESGLFTVGPRNVREWGGPMITGGMVSAVYLDPRTGEPGIVSQLVTLRTRNDDLSPSVPFKPSRSRTLAFAITDPTPAEVAIRLRTMGSPGPVLTVLTQALAPKASTLLDEIADTLVAVAVGTASPNLAFAAAMTLASASRGVSGIAGMDDAVPYEGGLDRLLRIVEEAQDIGVRAGALSAFRSHPDTTRSLALIRRVAASRNGAAWFAVHLLSNETGPRGLRVAEDLHREGAVTEERAKELLERVAELHGWR